MIYYTGIRVLYTITGQTYKLNKTEHKLLVCLSNNECTSYELINKYVDRMNIPRLISSLRKKGLHIVTKRTIGFLLKDEIYFT